MRSWIAADIYKPIGSYNRLIYDGPSQLNGERILVIATAQNGNRKIGHMLQLWIIPAISPIAAVRSGADASVCGDCQHRGDVHGSNRSCYVEWWRAVENIWQARDKARPMTPEAFALKFPRLQLRIGAYGDPVAVPMSVWSPLLLTAGGWTAYTHQWRTAPALYQLWCMASVDSRAEQREAERLGWRTFRVRGAGEPLADGREIACPASDEGGHRVLCASCELCRGQYRRSAKHIAIIAHGTGAKHFEGRRVIPLTVTR